MSEYQPPKSAYAALYADLNDPLTYGEMLLFGLLVGVILAVCLVPIRRMARRMTRANGSDQIESRPGPSRG